MISRLTPNGAFQYLYTWELLTEQPSLYDLLIRKHYFFNCVLAVERVRYIRFVRKNAKYFKTKRVPSLGSGTSLYKLISRIPIQHNTATIGLRARGCKLQRGVTSD
jgi:hypothetical protein